jgi:hypothetical protein
VSPIVGQEKDISCFYKLLGESWCRILLTLNEIRLDRAISGSLDVPVSLSDRFISSTLYVECPEAPAPMPWLDDLPPSDIPHSSPTLGTFAHICKIRLIQSYILNTMQAVPFEGSEATPEWQESMKMQIDQWADEIHSHR